jgi:hypothetical protein
MKSKIEELLDSLDLGRPRSPDGWTAVYAEIERKFGESQELRKMARPPTGLWTKYIKEVLPLTRLAQRWFPERQDVLLEPNLRSSGNYDAVITLPSGKEPTKVFVEFTYPKSGHEDSLRQEVLNEKDRVIGNLLLGDLTYRGTKRTGHHIDIKDDVVPKPCTLQKHRRLIIDGIKAKADKRYGPDHILVVVFDDCAGFRSDDIADLTSSLASEIDLSTLDFGSLYLLGSSGKTLSELPLQHWLTFSQRALRLVREPMAAPDSSPYERALAINEKAYGRDHPKVATSLNNLALLYKTQGQYTQAEPLYKRSLAIGEKALGPGHPDVATSLENMAALFRKTGREKEAEALAGC